MDTPKGQAVVVDIELMRERNYGFKFHMINLEQINVVSSVLVVFDVTNRKSLEHSRVLLNKYRPELVESANRGENGKRVALVGDLSYLNDEEGSSE